MTLFFILCFFINDKAMTNTLPKSERLFLRDSIRTLFSSGSKSVPRYPVRMVYRFVDEGETPAAILVSVPKKHFKRAVKRNRVKRQIREAYRRHKDSFGTIISLAYRRHKDIIVPKLEAAGRRVSIAFVWMSDELSESALVEEKITDLLNLLSEKI